MYMIAVLLALSPRIAAIATPQDELCYHKMQKFLSESTMTMPPRLSRENPIVVEMAGGFMGLQDLVEKENRVELMLELEWRWEDHRFEWNETECEHDEMTLYPASKIWFPWMMVTNDYSQNVWPDLWNNNPVQVFRNGTVLWEWAKKFSVVCNFDLTRFPVDKQECSVALTMMSGVTVHESHFLDMDPHIRYVDNVVWDVDKLDVTLDKMKHNMTEIIIHIHLTRRITFYMFSLIMPSMTLSFLPCFTFILPPDNGEKASVALTTLLTYFVMSLSFFESIPTTNTLPLIAVVFLYETVLSAVCALLAVIIVKVADIEKKAEKNRMELTYAVDKNRPNSSQVAPQEEASHGDNTNANMRGRGRRSERRPIITAKRMNTVCAVAIAIMSICPNLIILVDIYTV